MDFFLPFEIEPFPLTLSYQDKILFLGSCFSEEIGKKMVDLKFDVMQNPNGILFDPLSIADAIFSYIENKAFDESLFFQLNGLWHSWKHHSSFSSTNRNEVLQKILNAQNAAHAFLKEAKVLIITLGTAYNYELKNTSKNVANCHKAPKNLFNKNLIATEEIKSDLLSTIAALESFNPSLNIIFTISPVRHVRDGVIENNRSKARLIEAVHSISEQKENAFYFPSYELVIDVLRDYRFYKNDFVHPDETAIDFVFEKFSQSFFDEQSKKIMKEVSKILIAARHKPFAKESEAHQQFIAAQLKIILDLEKRFPFIDFSREKKIYNENLTAN